MKYFQIEMDWLALGLFLITAQHLVKNVQQLKTSIEWPAKLFQPRSIIWNASVIIYWLL